ncbi:hypothetical protein BJX63DRAFT_175886 [Aspergillus granulosus]|uniref:Uncharacterized protein n=1 Tax=Aspergillus granulosus TaxID=176169 RepID=A0ABR4I2G5_9EURO
MMSGRPPGQAQSTVTRSARSGVAIHQQIFHRRSIWNHRPTHSMLKSPRPVLVLYCWPPVPVAGKSSSRLVWKQPPMAACRGRSGDASSGNHWLCRASEGRRWKGTRCCFKRHLTRSVPFRAVAKRNRNWRTPNQSGGRRTLPKRWWFLE